jgi:hypothetical protein
MRIIFKKIWINLLLAVLIFSASAENVLARGGGGGSAGGGGGGGGGTSGLGGGIESLAFVIIFLIVVLVYLAYSSYKRGKQIEKTNKIINEAEKKDPSWDGNELEKRVRDVFLKFQADWSKFDVESMRSYLTDSYYRRMVLELKVLESEGRQNLMENVKIYSVTILEAVDDANDSKDYFKAEIFASARDVLFDTVENKELYVDINSFTEFWTFKREDGTWKLNLIEQETEDAYSIEPQIADFAKRNNFFYDPDFGWLMMPNKGVIFSQSNFKTSDINNHVVGYFRDKIVEFYTFIPNVKKDDDIFSSNYLVAQTVVPKAYNDILVRRKRRFFNFGPKGLERVETESNSFEGKFCIWADKNDQVNSLELLAPNFMEKIYALPFELNIEVVGNFIYFYAKSRVGVDYEKMLEILAWAFDEMER